MEDNDTSKLNIGGGSGKILRLRLMRKLSMCHVHLKSQRAQMLGSSLNEDDLLTPPPWQSISYWVMHFFKFNFKYKKNALKMTSPTVLVPWLQYSLQSSDGSPVYRLLQDSGYLLNLLRVKHLCHLPLILLLPDPGLPASLPAGLEATEEGQDCILLSWTFQIGRTAADIKKK